DQAHALCVLGNALVALGDCEAAQHIYQRSLELRRELGQANLAIDPLAGLARVALATGDFAQAQAYATEIADYLAENTPDGADEPLRAYLTCYEVLRASDVSRANKLLRAAHDILQERASQIADPVDRQSFLERVAAHRTIAQAF